MIKKDNIKITMQNQEDKNIENIIGIFETYGIFVSWYATSVGPTVLKYEFKPQNDKDILRYRAKKDDIICAIESLIHSPRIYIFKSDLYGSIIIVEVRKEEPTYVDLKECLQELNLSGKEYELPIILGKDTEGNLIIKDLVNIPNILMGGATGTGKTVFLNSVVLTLLTTKTSDEVNLVLIDPKMCVQFGGYNDTQYLLFPGITDPDIANKALTWSVDEMMRRYDQLKQSHVNTLTEYKKALQYPGMPYIVILVDEFADLVLSGDDSELKFQRLAQMGKTVGIHMILSTSCPKESVFTDRLRELIPGRIAGALISKVDSQRVLDQDGAESLLGNGDMIYKNMLDGEVVRTQTPLISYEDSESIIKTLEVRNECHCKDPECRKCLLVNCNDDNCKVHPLREKQRLREQYISKEFKESEKILFEKVKQLVLENQSISTETLQRKLQIGYSTAVRLLNKLKGEK